MKNREYFLRPDLKEYTPKFLLFCNYCNFSINKFADINKKDYICRIKIEGI